MAQNPIIKPLLKPMKNMKLLLILLTWSTLIFACKKTSQQQVQNPAIEQLATSNTKSEAAKQVAGVPQKAYTVAEYVAKYGKAPQGYVGGTVFQNRERLLPVNNTYKEYDVNPKVNGQNRGPERIVISADWNRYYTGDHYKTFIKF